MNALSAHLDGVAVLGPGLGDWPATAAILSGASAYAPGPAQLPAVQALPAAERRRTGRIVRLAIALGLEAAARAELEPASLPAIFSSSAGDGDNCHEICAALATAERQLSPTRFHNSVHNAAAGYWSIATGAMAASTALCAYDASFAAGLLEALAQVEVLHQSVLLIAYDTKYPPPLHDKRPLIDAFGTAFVLAPARSERSVARLAAALSDGTVDVLEDPTLEALRSRAPAGRCLPLLSAIARQESRTVHLEYLGATILRTEVSLC